MTSTKSNLATHALIATLLFLFATTSNAHIRKLSQVSTDKLTLAAVVGISPTTQPTVPQIPANKLSLYVFGDSLYDTGMGLYGKKGPAAAFYPYGISRFGTPAGRFSNGYLIPDFIANYAGLAFPEPYLRPGFSNYTEAVNFADAAAGVLVETRPGTLNLKLQVAYFVEMVGKLKQQYGENQTSILLNRAVFLFNIGANDYVDIYNQNPKPLSPALVNLRQNQVIGNLSTHIDTIYSQGGRKFAFQYAAPLGCLPAFLIQPNGTCSDELNGLARMYNDGLQNLIKEKAGQLQGFKYSIYDFYNSLLKRKANGPQYGFNETQSACCGSGQFNRIFSCGNKDQSQFTYCGHPADYLWFDAGHPTEKADEEFAKEFWSGDISVVGPSNLMSLFKF